LQGEQVDRTEGNRQHGGLKSAKRTSGAGARVKRLAAGWRKAHGQRMGYRSPEISEKSHYIRVERINTVGGTLTDAGSI